MKGSKKSGSESHQASEPSASSTSSSSPSNSSSSTSSSSSSSSSEPVHDDESSSAKQSAREKDETRIEPSSSSSSDSSSASSSSSSSDSSDSDDSSSDHSSSSSKRRRTSQNSQDKPKNKKKRKPLRLLDLPDFDLIAESSYGGRTPLTKYLPAVELQSLIGWATHVSQDHMVDATATGTKHNNNNPLLNLDSISSPPPRPGELTLIQDAMQQFLRTERADYFPILTREFDQSALVTLGCCLEEMVTALLLPYAHAHVRRCQSLLSVEKAKQRGRSGNNETTTTTTFAHELTLPPEEAILKLRPAMIDATAALPTMRPAQTAEPSMVKSSFFRPSAAVEARQALQKWLHAHGIDPMFFQKNRDTFALLIGSKKT